MRFTCWLPVGLSLACCLPAAAQTRGTAAPSRGRSGYDAPAPAPSGRSSIQWNRVQLNYIDVRQLTAFLGAPNFPSEADLYWSGLQGGGMGGFGFPGAGMGGGMMGGGMGMPGMIGGSYTAGQGMMPGIGFPPGAGGGAAGGWFPGTYLLGDPRTNGMIMGR